MVENKNDNAKGKACYYLLATHFVYQGYSSTTHENDKLSDIHSETLISPVKR